MTYRGERLFGHTFDPEQEDKAHGWCPSCRERVSAEPEYVYQPDGTVVIAYLLLRPECPVCFSTLLVASARPRCKHYRCGRFVKAEGDYCRKHRRKPKPQPRVQGHCPVCGRFLPLNRMGRPRRYCREPRRCRLGWWRTEQRRHRIAGKSPPD